MTEKLISILRITRPFNLSITFFSVIVAALICQTDEILWLNAIVAALSASIVMAAGNIINDIYDIEIDKINRPARPLPSGLISITFARLFYAVLVLISFVLSFFLNFEAILIVIGSTILLFLYSKYLKGIPFIGNVLVSFLTGMVFIFGGVAVNNPTAAIIPAVFAFLINLIRELVKDMQDVEGDEKVGYKTFPIKYGTKKTLQLILIIGLMLILATCYPFITRLYNIEYFILIMVIVNPIIIYSLKTLFEDQSVKNLSKISYLLKFSMLFGLIAIFLG